MRDYVHFCRKRWPWLLFPILIFGAVGSVFGASKESVLWSDTLTDLNDGAVLGENVPYMAEIFGLAEEQSLWLSFRYAFWEILAGILVSFLLSLLLYHLRRTKWFRAVDQCLYG